MWVFTQEGFVSTVNHGREDGKLTVRARDERSLHSLADMAETEIVHTPQRDYEHRVFVFPSTYAEWLTMHVESLDYGNFKDRVKVSRGKRWAHACGSVWATMLDVSDTHEVPSLDEVLSDAY
jgi:hypothetical protein